MPSKKKSGRGKTTEARERGATSIPSQAVLVAPPSSSANANEGAGLSQSHALSKTKNVLITGGQFPQIQGHQANVVIHINQNSSESSSESPSESPSDTPSSSVGQGKEETPLQRSNDIYERHLTLKGRGFPLWMPGPGERLHTDYRRTGIRIGDVGIINDFGGFIFLFNICLPHDDPVNPRVLPEHFAPISPLNEATDIDEFLAFGNGSHLASASIKRSRTDIDISFESSASEGAILTMPRGARSEDLGNFARFREYAAANVADWYKFVNGFLGREAKNGDIRLVVGFDKTTSWGMATFVNQTKQDNCHLRFRLFEGAGSHSTYAWEYSGDADVKDSNHNDPPGLKNQCLFMRTLNINLADNFWAEIHSSLGSVHVNSQNSQKYPPLKDYSSNHPHPNNLGTGSSSIFLSSQGLQSGTQRTAPHGAAVDEVGLDDNPTIFISGPPGRIMVHPSKVLNNVLLAKIPTAKMVITHDDDWSSFITQHDTWPDLHEVTMNILSIRNICEENGVIFLGPQGSFSAPLHPVEAKSKLKVIKAKTLFNKRRGNVVGFHAPGNDTAEEELPRPFQSSTYGRSGLLSDDDLAGDLGLLNINPNDPPSSSSQHPPSQPSSLPIYAPLSRSPPSRDLMTYQSINLSIPGGTNYSRQAIGTPSEGEFSAGGNNPSLYEQHLMESRFEGRGTQHQQSELTARYIPGQGIQYMPSQQQGGIQGGMYHPPSPKYGRARAPSYSGASNLASPISPTTSRAISPQQPPYYLQTQRRLSDAQHNLPPSSSQHLQQNLSDLGKGVPLHAVPPSWPLFIVEFKAGRTDLFYLPDLLQNIRTGDLVIVEADRGRDLGTVVNDSITLAEVEAFERQQMERGFGGSGGGSGSGEPTSPGGITSPGGAGNGMGKKEINPKMIYGKATAQDMQLLAAKNQDEQKALQLCQSKVRAKKLPMEVIDAEYQWDRRKLTFYFVAEKRIDFRKLVRELFRLYRTQIWMASLQGGGEYEQ